MAMRMNHCAGCQKHFFLTATRCPHCGTEAAAGPVTRFVRQARMGGLMLFTALTTTACYGSPSYVGELPGTLRPNIEAPRDKRVPSQIGQAYLYVTPAQGRAESSQVLEVNATIEGAVLTLQSVDGSLAVRIEAPNAAAFATVRGVREALNVEQMKSLVATASYWSRPATQASSSPATQATASPSAQASSSPTPATAASAGGPDVSERMTITMKVPGDKPVTGVLQLSRLDEMAVGGTLLLNSSGQSFQLYFLAAR